MEYKYTIHDLPSENRPRERMMLLGPEALSDVELLAILIRSGTPKEDVLQLSQKLIIEYGGLTPLFQTSLSKLQSIPGLGPAKSCILAACFELSKRLTNQDRTLKPLLNSPQDIAHIFISRMKDLKQEHLKAAYLDVKNRLIEHRTISIGTLDSSLVHPRDIFRHAVNLPCAAIVLIHNHPTGDPSPSQEDIQVTKRVAKAGKIMGIPLLDHIIIGNGLFISLKEKNLMG